MRQLSAWQAAHQAGVVVIFAVSGERSLAFAQATTTTRLELEEDRVTASGEAEGE